MPLGISCRRRPLLILCSTICKACSGAFMFVISHEDCLAWRVPGPGRNAEEHIHVVFFNNPWLTLRLHAPSYRSTDDGWPLFEVTKVAEMTNSRRCTLYVPPYDDVLSYLGRNRPCRNSSNPQEFGHRPGLSCPHLGKVGTRAASFSLVFILLVVRA